MATQRDQIVKHFDNVDGCGVLDYVTGWYISAAKFIQATNIKVAFVSTNSIVQGEQTSILWGQMLNKYKIKIHFAHRTFKWSNEAKGNAAVFCVIIGFANYDTTNKSIFEYEDIKGEAHEIKAKNINPYLVDAKDIIIKKSTNAICLVPTINPVQRENPTTDKHIKLISLFLIGLTFYRFVEESDMIKFMFSDSSAIWDYSMILYFTPILLLPTAAILLWYRKKLGWTLSTFYFTYTAMGAIPLFIWALNRKVENTVLYSILPATSPTVYISTFLLFGGAVWVMTKENIMKTYNIDRRTMYITIGLGVIIVLLTTIVM